MIKWRHPSSAPKDTSYFALVDQFGNLESCTFDPDEQGGKFVIAAIPGLGKRVSDHLSVHVGWARWSEVFEHIRATAHVPT